MLKLIKVILTIILIILTYLYVEYNISERERINNFIKEINFSIILLKALDENKTNVVKNILFNDINRIFYIAGSKDNNLEPYSDFCKFFNADIYNLMKKYDSDTEQKILKVFPDSLKIKQQTINGRVRMINFCQEKETIEAEGSGNNDNSHYE